MNLQKIYPVEDVRSKFDCGVDIKFYGMANISDIAKQEPECLRQIGENAWIHYMVAVTKIKSKKLCSYFDEDDPFLYRQVEKLIKQKVIQDIVLVQASVADDTLERSVCGKLLLARTYPNNIHISGVEFSNPYEPVSEDERCYLFHRYRSLGLFSTLLDNVLMYCKENKISKITLSAASPDQVKYFESHGFSIEKTDFVNYQVACGLRMPMERDCT
ncbi:MAG: hypothetical protein KBT53_09915 [Porticoccus sp.]|nr:hypothetical protein [Porticoccus sp.]MBQ0807089.1 hypothetical protein [Porticoccus sp.]